jgi:hypothetical protein
MRLDRVYNAFKQTAAGGKSNCILANPIKEESSIVLANPIKEESSIILANPNQEESSIEQNPTIELSMGTR